MYSEAGKALVTLQVFMAIINVTSTLNGSAGDRALFKKKALAYPAWPVDLV